MSRPRLIRRLLILLVVGSAGLALTLMVPKVGQAGSLCIYEASVGCGNVRHIDSPAIGVVLDIDYDAGTGEYGGIYGFGEFLIETTGDVFMEAFTCGATTCTPNFPGPGSTSLQVTGGDGVSGETGPEDLGLLTITGYGFGEVNVVSGRYFDADFNDRSIDPVTLAVIDCGCDYEPVPEPGTLVLMSLGLAGLALLRLR